MYVTMAAIMCQRGLLDIYVSVALKEKMFEMKRMLLFHLLLYVNRHLLGSLMSAWLKLPLQ